MIRSQENHLIAALFSVPVKTTGSDAVIISKFLYLKRIQSASEYNQNITISHMYLFLLSIIFYSQLVSRNHL